MTRVGTFYHTNQAKYAKGITETSFCCLLLQGFPTLHTILKIFHRCVAFHIDGYGMRNVYLSNEAEYCCYRAAQRQRKWPTEKEPPSFIRIAIYRPRRRSITAAIFLEQVTSPVRHLTWPAKDVVTQLSRLLANTTIVFFKQQCFVKRRRILYFFLKLSVVECNVSTTKSGIHVKRRMAP